ncbi:SLAM family member 7-like isoform X2 [Hirundo rustica]|uniref:SLAM family member 7-like isoform X2 n=1 Tax=Hirundo rustica TaxID=43150 RepID=UPI0026739965|nr:SLAM family member 7-like isoform X2 [Hirundo rustica]
MELLWIPLLSILAFPRRAASDPTELIGALGSSVTFRSRSRDEGPAFWDFGGDPIVTVPDEDGAAPVFSKGYKKRLSVSERGRELNISRLRMEDAGTYSVSINGKKSTFTLQVYRELAEPTVTCEARNCSGGSCSFSLRCSAPGTGLGNVSYTWRVSGRRREGEFLVLQESSGREPEPLTCTARNAVSSRNVSVSTAGMLCADAVSGSWVRIGLGAGLGVGVGLLIFLVLLRKSKGWRKFRLSKPKPTDTAESMTVYAEVGPCQQDGDNGAVTGLELV